MKTRHLINAAALGLGLAVFILPSAPALADPARQLERMAEQLQLDPAQRADIEALIDAHRSRMDELGLDRETRREGQAERHALMQEILAVLTPEQRQQWVDTRDERRNSRQQGQRTGQGMQQLLESLDLSDQQRASIKALAEQGRERGRANRADFMRELEQILTPEQWAVIEARRAAGRGGKGSGPG